MNTSTRTLPQLRNWAAGWVVAMTIAIAPAALAAPCAGFTDVDDTNPFCQNIEWIKNRGVTLGCQAPGNPPIYCPSTAVPREQMAAFMNRLGNVLSPAVFLVEEVPGGGLTGPIDLDALPATRICVTPNSTGTPSVVDVPPADYPRRAFIAATFSGLTGGALQYRTELQFSNNSGASWDFVWESYVNRDGANSAHWLSSSQTGTVDLEPDLPYRFSMLVSRVGAGAADFTDSRCFFTVAVYSRTGTSSPFDQIRVKPPNADH